MSSCGGDGARSVTECRNASRNGTLATLGMPQVDLTLQVLIYAATPASTNGQRVRCLSRKDFSYRWSKFSLRFGFTERWCIFQREACICLFEDIDFMSFFSHPSLFLIEVNSQLCIPFYASQSLFFIHLTCWHIWQHTAVLSSTNPQL